MATALGGHPAPHVTQAPVCILNPPWAPTGTGNSFYSEAPYGLVIQMYIVLSFIYPVLLSLVLLPLLCCYYC